MANVPVVVTSANGNTPAVGQLFENISFFLAARLPTRSKFVADIEANGGRIVKVEKNADYMIVDHMRKPTQAGTFSYTLIEQAIRDGAFPDPAEHALGASSRAVGSAEPVRRTRTAFTAEDDKALWQWVEHEKSMGQLAKGNDIYKRLEEVNKRHTWQAWRDRYVKKLMDNPPHGVTVGADALSSAEESEEESQSAEEEVDQADFDLLWAQAKDINNIADDQYEDAWVMWAQMNQNHSASTWRQIWESDVRPAYLKHRAAVKAKRRFTSISGDDESPAGSKQQKQGKKRKVAAAGGDVDVNSPALPAAEREIPDDGLLAVKAWTESSQGKTGSRLRPEGSDLPTSEVNQAVSQQLETEMNGESSKEPRSDGEQMVTSDANRAADLQIRQETIEATPKQPASAEKAIDHLITSEANRAAETQLHGEGTNGVSGEHSLHGHDINENGEIVPGNDLRAWYAEKVAELNANADRTGLSSDLEDDRLDRDDEATASLKTSTEHVHALTEANLVSQQAEHAEPLIRGVDLPQDEQNKDQSQYVKFLQKVTGQEEEADSGGVESGDELPSAPRPLRAPEAAADTQEPPAIPLSSQREVDNVVEDALQWPSSPRNKQPERGSQESQFETQVPFPRLPLATDHLRSLMPEFELSSQSVMSQTDGDHNRNQGEHEGTARTLRPAAHQHTNGVQESSQDGRQPDIFEGLDDINEIHIELTIPEPEGDFTFTSSPERQRPAPSQEQVAITQASRDADSEVDDFEAIEEYVQKTGPVVSEVVDISSDAPSSSLDSQVSRSLPQPTSNTQARRKHAVETQDILNAETQLPDFYMPLPKDDQEDEVAPQPSKRHAKETQDILAAETQMPDLSIPLPRDMDSEMEAGANMSSHAPPKQPKPRRKGKEKVVESQTLDVEKELESWLDRQHVRGFSEVSAIAAMHHSSMRPDLAELVLLAEKGGLGLPKDVPGIWSDREDEILESGDSGALRRLEAKHGWDECDARMKFLAEWRET